MHQGISAAENNMFGKESILYIKTRLSNNSTVVEDSYFTAPYKIVKPFYDNVYNMANIMVMSASAGVMEGDSYKLDVELGNSTAVSLVGQSFTKVHRMLSGSAKQNNTFKLGDKAFFDYDPKPTIPFGGSEFTSNTICYLGEGAHFIYSDILACGREKSGELFAFKQYNNCIKVYYQNKLIYMDKQRLNPKIQKLNDIGFFEGFTHQAQFAYFNDNAQVDALAERIYSVLQGFEDIEAGVSITYKIGISVRILANGSDYLEKILNSIRFELYKETCYKEF